VLALRDELNLTIEQVAAVAAIDDDMRKRVVPAGDAYLDAQRALESAFRAGTLGASELPARVAEVATLEAALASGHLAAHLRTAAVLTPHQIAEYNRLRGYT
jgi:Spy/CpxP family protein refolding chaperone